MAIKRGMVRGLCWTRQDRRFPAVQRHPRGHIFPCFLLWSYHTAQQVLTLGSSPAVRWKSAMKLPVHPMAVQKYRSL
jgi:hypothetical protein